MRTGSISRCESLITDARKLEELELGNRSLEMELQRIEIEHEMKKVELQRKLERTKDSEREKHDKTVEDKEQGVYEKSLPTVKESADYHEFCRKREREEANRFPRWKEAVGERKRYELQTLEEECTGLTLAETEACIKRHQQRKHVDAALRVEENYMKKSCGYLLLTRKTPTGNVTERIIISKVHDGLADRVVKFSVS